MLRTYCRAAALAVAGLGCLVLCGWWLGIDALKSVVPGMVAMKANAALGLVLSGVSSWLAISEQTRPRLHLFARALGLVVLGIGTATISEYLFGRNLGIDQLLVSEPAGAVGTYSPGRMAPTTSISFMAIGLSLSLLDWKTRSGRRPSQALSLISALIALMAISGYLYD